MQEMKFYFGAQVFKLQNNYARIELGMPAKQNLWQHGDPNDDISANQISAACVGNVQAWEQQTTSTAERKQNKLRRKCVKNIKSKQNNCTIMMLNAQSVFKKSDILKININNFQVDWLVVTETWLHPDIDNREFLPPEFNVIRKDRQHKKGGGILIAINKAFDCQQIEVNDNKHSEIVWCKINQKNKRKSVHLCGVYRPPDSTNEWLETLQANLENIFRSEKHPHVILTGDFNFPNIDWVKGLGICSAHQNSQENNFINILNEYGLEQLVEFPTRFSDKTKKGNILDLMFTNNTSIVQNASVEAGISDHELVVASVHLKGKEKANYTHWSYCYNKTDFVAFNKDLEEMYEHFVDQFSTSDVDKNWNHFTKIMEELTLKHVPKKETKVQVQNPWMNVKLRREIRKKERLFKNYKRARSDTSLLTYKLHCKKLRVEIKEAKYNFFNNILGKQIKENPKKFWNFVNRNSKSRGNIESMRNSKGIVTDNKQFVAEILNKSFHSVFTNDDSAGPVNPPCSSQTRTDTRMSEIDITFEGILKQIQNLDPNKSCGPDGVHGAILKNTANQSARYLLHIFRQSLDLGRLPLDWKTAFVSPIFKEGDPLDPLNYRPISLTSVVCKIMEHIIVSNIMSFLEGNKLLNANQHGFRQCLSCDTQLVELVNDLQQWNEKNFQIDLVFLDFKKAFDKVSHTKLIEKLSWYKIDNKVIDWITDFVKDRTQAVKLNNVISNKLDVLSGVPQGSVLGPVLFNIYINDLPDSIRSIKRMYADDCVIYRKIETIGDTLALQQDLLNVVTWCKEWKMELNVKKCKTMTVKKSNTNIIVKEYELLSQQLEKVNVYKYLGVLLDSKLNWKEHMLNLHNKAIKRLNFLKRNMYEATESTKKNVYQTMIRPILEYACAVWDPHLQGTCLSLERIQRQAIRFITNKYKFDECLSITEEMNRLEITTLQNRRTKFRLSHLYKIMKGYVKIDNLNCKEAGYKSRHDHNFKIEPIFSSNNAYMNSFYPRTIEEWNALPITKDAYQSIENFEQFLNLFYR
jgi:Reverse transcriptase (RNA-dependent DNA polymerase)/Endonuclease-reverse transcriptase